ncbi:DUF2332 family protein [Streptomyces sp. NPDC004822]
MTSAAGTIAELRAMAAGVVEHAPMSSVLCEKLADDIERSGQVWNLLKDHPESGQPFFGVKVISAVRWLSLSGLAPELDSHLRDLIAGIGDRRYMARMWQLSSRALLDNPHHTRSALDRPVQQHQPSSAGHLLSALAMLGASKVRLLEIGACAGLNLLVDRYHWFGRGWDWGDSASPVRLVAPGRSPRDLAIVERAGCDLAPRDASDPMDRLILHSFLLPEWDIERLDLDDALDLASKEDLRIDRGKAAEWLADELSRPPRDGGACTVIWHSRYTCCLTSQQDAAIEQILSEAGTRMPVARAGLKPTDWLLPPRVELTVY